MVKKKFGRYEGHDIQKYNRYLPTAFDDSLSLLEKMNKLIRSLDYVGENNNDMSEYLEFFINTFDDNLTSEVLERLLKFNDEGLFDELIKKGIFIDFSETLIKLQKQIDDLIINDGESDAEVVQARAGLDVLYNRIDEILSLLKDNRTVLNGDLKGRLLRGYYYYVENGAYKPGVNWYHYKILTHGDLLYTFEHNDPESTARVVMFDKDDNYLNQKFLRIGEFTVDEGTAWFSINVSLPNSVPSTANKPYYSIEDVSRIVIRKSDGIEQRINKMQQEIKDNLTGVNIPIPGTEKWTQVDADLSPGYYSSVSGNYTNGTNWFNFSFSKPPAKTFEVRHTTESGDVRLIMFNGTSITDTRIIPVNTTFEVPSNVDRIAINIKGENASPNTNVTSFPLSSMNNFSLHVYLPETETNPLVAQINQIRNLVESGGKSDIRVLMVGNSFSYDMCEYLDDIMRNAGINFEIGVLYIAGAKLEDHKNNVLSQDNVYTYHHWSYNDGYSTQSSKNFDFGVKYKNWDIITFQQASGYSGLYNHYTPFLNDLITHVKEISNNPNLQIGLNMTWAYSTNSTHPAFETYNNDQQNMYSMIMNANKNALKEHDINLFLPLATVIQNARLIPELKSIGNELTRDGYHLDLYGGRYIAALTAFTVLTNTDVMNVNYKPENVNSYQQYMSKLCVKNALLTPFKTIKLD